MGEKIRMVLPPELEKKNQHAKSLEQQLTEKFFNLQIAREERYTDGSDVMFDEISKSIEVLLRAIPEAFNILLEKRKELDRAFEEERNNIYQRANQAPDDISKEFLWNRQIEAAKWEYRELYEELIIDVLQEFQLIHMMRPPQVVVVPTESQQPPVEEQQPIPDVQQQTAVQQEPLPPEPKKRLRFALSRPREPTNII